MNTTTNYQLNQWEPEDRILRTDFNADNAKIDAAIKAAADASPYVKLLDVTTTVDAAQVDLDVSTLNLAEYIEINFYYKASATDSIWLRTNNLSNASYYALNKIGSTQHSQCLSNILYAPPLQQPASIRFHPVGADVPIALHSMEVYNTSSYLAASMYIGWSPVTWGQLTTLNVVASTGTISAGSSFLITGVKR